MSTIFQYDSYPGIRTDTFVPDRLIAGDFPIETNTIGITAGLQLLRGSVLGLVTSTGNYVLATSAASDGSQLPVNWVVLAENVDTSSTGFNGVANAPAYLTGDFNSAAMTFGAGITAATAAPVLRANNIYLHTAISGDPV